MQLNDPGDDAQEMLVDADGRKVVRLPRRRGRTVARHAAPTRSSQFRGRHTPAPRRQNTPLHIVRTGAGGGRHAAQVTRRTAHMRTGSSTGPDFDRYDRFMLWTVGCLLTIRTALLGIESDS